MPSPFFGMRGSGDWSPGSIEPGSYREAILYEEPNGMTPITGILSMMSSTKIDNRVQHWYTQTLAGQAGDGAVYIDAAVGTPYVYSTHHAAHGVAGATVYVKVALALAQEFREGHTVALIDTDRNSVDVVGKVVGITYNGASSVIAVLLKEDDDNAGADVADYNLATVDRIAVIGNSNAEGADTPDPIAYDPTEYYNRTQIFRTSLALTRTAMRTRLRTGDAVKKAKKEALMMHGVELEKALVRGIRGSFIGSNGKPEGMMGGIPWFIRDAVPANIIDFRYDDDVAGSTWVDGGENWIEDQLASLSAYAKGEVIGVCGNGVLSAINKIAKLNGNFELTSSTQAYGIKVKTWDSIHMTVHFKSHPLFSRDPALANSVLLMDPRNISYCYIDDTHYLPKRGGNGIDGELSEFLTECTIEVHFPNQFMLLHGVGLDNNLSG